MPIFLFLDRQRGAHSIRLNFPELGNLPLLAAVQHEGGRMQQRFRFIRRPAVRAWPVTSMAIGVVTLFSRLTTFSVTRIKSSDFFWTFSEVDRWGGCAHPAKVISRTSESFLKWVSF